MTDEEWHHLHKDIQKVWILFTRPSFRQGIESIFRLLDIQELYRPKSSIRDII